MIQLFTVLAVVFVSLLVRLQPTGSVLGTTSLGYSRQTVRTGADSFVVQTIAADSSTTRVVVDTASPGNCSQDCPVLPLKTYVTRNRAIAGINGTYFCPASYPTCASKKNSFDLLVMNKDKTYFNSDNNVYSSHPAMIFGGSYVRTVRSVSEWGRDTGIDGMLSNFPLLVFNKEVVFTGSDPKWNTRGSRNFIGHSGNRVYIGIVRNATVAETAKVLQSMGLENAMNLDSGGSTALWANGAYRAGPGRAIPNAILFVPR